MPHTSPTARWNIFQSNENGRWYFHLQAPNNKIIAKAGQSDGYDTAAAALDDVKLIKRLIEAERRKAFNTFRSEQDKQWYFNIPDESDVLLTSEGYKTSGGKLDGINDILAYFTCDVVIVDKKMKP